MIDTYKWHGLPTVFISTLSRRYTTNSRSFAIINEAQLHGFALGASLETPKWPLMFEVEFSLGRHQG